ncbi:MAG: hypothetical protein ACE5RP_00145 [Nitrosopumilus sp.]
MADATKRLLDYNLLLFAILVGGIAGLIYLAMAKINGGLLYGWMLVALIAFVTLITIFRMRDSEFGGTTDYFRIALATKLSTASFVFLLGLSVPYLLYFFAGGTALSPVNFAVPMFGQQITDSFQSFSASQISNSPVWERFVIVFVAGGFETFMFSFIALGTASLIGLLFWKLITNDKTKKVTFAENLFVRFVALIIVTIVFMAIHSFNNNYASLANYLFAGGFILFSNLTIVSLGVFLTFWVGFHMSANAIFLIDIYGFGYMFETTTETIYMIVSILFVLILALYVVRNWEEVIKDISQKIKDSFKKFGV